VADILGDRTGTVYAEGDLWPAHPALSSGSGTAEAGLRPSWTPADTATALAELAATSATDRMRISAVRGTELITVALDGTQTHTGALRSMVSGERVGPPMADLIADHIAGLRRLDDRQGGGTLSLRYVAGELHNVLELLRGGSYGDDIGRRLFASAAELAQLAGWMSFDAGAAGAAQRFFLLGVRAATLARDDPTAANILGMLSYQAAHSGQPAESVRLAEAAERLAGRSGPGVQARAAGRLATAHAAAGDLYAFREAAERARTLLGRRLVEGEPAALYYLSPEQLSAEAGQALVGLAAVSPGHAQRLLGEAVELLGPLTSAGLREDYQRSALLHGSYLALAHLRRRDLEAAAAATAAAAQRLPGVVSHRCHMLLGQLRQGLARRKRNAWAADAVEHLDAVLVQPRR